MVTESLDAMRRVEICRVCAQDHFSKFAKDGPQCGPYMNRSCPFEE